MTNKLYFPPSLPVVPAQEQLNRKGSENNSSFQGILDQQLGSLKISAHAQKRLDQRKIALNNDSLTKLTQAVNKAEEKGAKDTLILMNNLAFVVSVENKTVITAMGQDSLKNNVFTQIDSAVII